MRTQVFGGNLDVPRVSFLNPPSLRRLKIRAVSGRFRLLPFRFCACQKQSYAIWRMTIPNVLRATRCCQIRTTLHLRKVYSRNHNNGYILWDIFKRWEFTSKHFHLPSICEQYFHISCRHPLSHYFLQNIRKISFHLSWFSIHTTWKSWSSMNITAYRSVLLLIFNSFDDA